MSLCKIGEDEKDESCRFILPSDAAKDRFPSNKAAQFSIPIDDAQQLNGQSEVAVAQLRYSNCLT